MRAIAPTHVALFLLLLGLSVAMAAATTMLLAGLPFGEFHAIALLMMAVLLTYLYAMLIYRLLLRWRPLHQGIVVPQSSEALAADLHLLFFLVLFNSLIRTHFLPVPLQRLIYLALGAKLGANTYSAGALLDPILTAIGSNTLIGHDAVVFAHVIEGQQLAFKTVVIGNSVTVGALAVIMAGVSIGDGAIISAGAVVTKDTRIGAGEVWGGVPARQLRNGPAAQ